jgi:hypothetical protein
MNPYRGWALAASASALLAAGGSALAQGKSLKDQIVGTWTYGSAADVKSDGTKHDRWGPGAKGILMFDRGGRFTLFITRADVPKFAAKSVNEGTPEENKAVVRGMIGLFGTYSVNEAEKTIITKPEGSTFPNLVGAEQRRKIVTLNAKELKYVNPTTSAGTTAEVVWKRAN